MSETQYVCVAPLIDVIIGADANGGGGSLQRIHQGGGLPLTGLHQKQVDHLLDRGMIAKAAVTGGLESVVVAAALAGDTAGAGAGQETAGPPVKSAAKAEWVAYAVSQRAEGADEDAARAEAEATSKEDLIAAYGA